MCAELGWMLTQTIDAPPVSVSCRLPQLAVRSWQSFAQPFANLHPASSTKSFHIMPSNQYNAVSYIAYSLYLASHVDITYTWT